MARSHVRTNVKNLYFGLMFFNMFESIKKEPQRTMGFNPEVTPLTAYIKYH